jgi:hypothetical protein
MAHRTDSSTLTRAVTAAVDHDHSPVPTASGRDQAPSLRWSAALLAPQAGSTMQTGEHAPHRPSLMHRHGHRQTRGREGERGMCVCVCVSVDSKPHVIVTCHASCLYIFRGCCSDLCVSCMFGTFSNPAQGYFNCTKCPANMYNTRTRSRAHRARRVRAARAPRLGHRRARCPALQASSDCTLALPAQRAHLATTIPRRVSAHPHSLSLSLSFALSFSHCP